MAPFTVQRGSDRRPEGERMARSPGGSSQPPTAKRQRWRGGRWPPKGLRRFREAPAMGRSGRPKRGSGQKSPQRGRRMAAQGTRKGPGELRERLSRRPGRVSWDRHGTGPSGCRRGARVPVALRVTTPRGGAGRTARARCVGLERERSRLALPAAFGLGLAAGNAGRWAAGNVGTSASPEAETQSRLSGVLPREERQRATNALPCGPMLRCGPARG